MKHSDFERSWWRDDVCFQLHKLVKKKNLNQLIFFLSLFVM